MAKVSSSKEVTILFSHEEIEKMVIHEINSNAGYLVPENYQITFNKDSSVLIRYSVTGENRIDVK